MSVNVKKVSKIPAQPPLSSPRIRVAAYARVSKDTRPLMHSLSAQVSHYISRIQGNPAWEYAGVYVDAGLTGTTMEARPEFQRLVTDCCAGKIDLVLTKSISRFARSTVDLLSTVRRLKALGVEVWFEREQLRSISGEGEVMLTILASFAQEESRSLSQNVKWSIQKKYLRGQVHSHQKMLGYRWEGESMVVVPEEAETVRRIYDSYLRGSSIRRIAAQLREQGVCSVRGKPFPAGSVAEILKNEQYTGCLLLQRSFNYRLKKQRRNLGEAAMYRVDHHHPAIISPEIFRKAAEIRERKREKAPRDPRFTSVFSSRVWCGKCGCKAAWHRSPQARRRGDMSSVLWMCGNKCRRGGCDCRTIQDRELHAAAQRVGLSAEQVARIELFDDTLKLYTQDGRVHECPRR